MSGTRTAAIRITTDDVARARQNLEALGAVGDAALRRVADAGQRAANAFASLQANLAGDAVKHRAADIQGNRLNVSRCASDDFFEVYPDSPGTRKSCLRISPKAIPVVP